MHGDVVAVSNQSPLPTDRAHDLPPRWDGLRVEWDPWQAEPWTSGVFHEKPRPCPACGMYEPRSVVHGVIWSPPGVLPFRRPKTYGEAALNQRAETEGTPLGHLVVWRCTGCRHDQVLDSRDSSVWDLDESDYNDDGSWVR